MVLLRIEILDYWHCGSGRGLGASLDAVCARDRLGLPVLPGRTLKGLLRDAVRRCPCPVMDDREARIAALFGGVGFTPATGENEPQLIEQPGNGRLTVTDARLPQAMLDYLGSLPERDLEGLRAPLFAQLAQTAIEHQRGAAKTNSLRTIEVAMPVTLEATIESTDDRWCRLVAPALTLLRAVGAYRSRGLGRCIATLTVSARADGPTGDG